jgi:large subunit ribosomal protein L9
MMEVILLERVAKLGRMGEVVNVRPGYARNFLLPQKKAVRATEDNRHKFEAQRAQLEELDMGRRSEAEQLADGLRGSSVVLVRQAGDSGQLYGSVTARDVAEATTAVTGIEVSRQQVQLPQPIKSLGFHAVEVALHPEVVVKVFVNVARTLDEAAMQAESGRAIVGPGEEPLETVSPEEWAEERSEGQAEGQAEGQEDEVAGESEEADLALGSYEGAFREPGEDRAETER